MDTVSKSEVARRIEALVKACRDNSLRVTQQRIAIFRELASTTEHPDALTLLERVRERIPSVSADTVYRTLTTLESHGLLRKVQTCGSNTRFDANTDLHHHYVCGHCGLVRDFCDERFDALEPSGEVAGWGDVSHVQVHIQGICTSCRAELDSARDEESCR